MAVPHAITGVYCAAATPLTADLQPDHERFAAHCRQLLADGCHGIALLGTTGEANSFSVAERQAILEGLLARGVAPEQLMPGTGVAASPDTVALTRHALSVGVTRVVMLPPFYYKGVSDDGLFAAYARIIEAVGDARLKVVLYHIPQTSGVALSQPLVARLLQAFPGTVAGIKDSSGDLANMQAMAAAHPDLSVLVGADPLLLPLLKTGGAGCITAATNLIAPDVRFVFDHHADPARAAELERAQARIVACRALTTTFMQLSTVKGMLVAKTGDLGWNRTRPPVLPLTAAELELVRTRYAALPQ